jgi:hypothetical protein
VRAVACCTGREPPPPSTVGGVPDRSLSSAANEARSVAAGRPPPDRERSRTPRGRGRLRP